MTTGSQNTICWHSFSYDAQFPKPTPRVIKKVEDICALALVSISNICSILWEGYGYNTRFPFFSLQLKLILEMPLFIGMRDSTKVFPKVKFLKALRITSGHWVISTTKDMNPWTIASNSKDPNRTKSTYSFCFEQTWKWGGSSAQQGWSTVSKVDSSGRWCWGNCEDQITELLKGKVRGLHFIFREVGSNWRLLNRGLPWSKFCKDLTWLRDLGRTRVDSRN